MRVHGWVSEVENVWREFSQYSPASEFRPESPHATARINNFYVASLLILLILLQIKPDLKVLPM